jgi:hypothetical protein
MLEVVEQDERAALGERVQQALRRHDVERLRHRR